MEPHSEESTVRIGVVGVGKGGTNAVERMIQEHIPAVRYITINTDEAAYQRSSADCKLNIALNMPKGYDIDVNPGLGYLSAKENGLQIRNVLRGCDMLFVVAGMGGGTGTGAAPMVAHIARNLGILTVGVVTKPFSFEGKRKIVHAEAGIKKLKEEVDSLIVIPNDNLKYVTEEKITFHNALAATDSVLVQMVKNIVDIIQHTAVINCDFADIKSVIHDAGVMHTATVRASGPDKADTIAEQIVASKLLGTTVDGATGVLLYITAPGSVGLEEVDKISSAVSNRAAACANIIFGIDLDDNMGNEIKAVLVATCAV